MPQIPTATLLIGYTHQNKREQAAFNHLAERLAGRLAQPVKACALDQPDRTVLHAITGLLQQGVVKIVILPLFLSPAEYQDNTVGDAVAFAGGRWPHAHFHLSPAPTWSEWLQVVGALSLEAMPKQSIDRHETAVILAGRGDSDPHVNSDLVKLARLLYETHDFGRVDVGFVEDAAPTVAELIARNQTLGVKQIVVISALLFAGDTHQQLLAQINAADANSQFTIVVTPCLSTHPALIDVLLARHQTALADRRLLPVNWQEIQGQLVAELEMEHKQQAGQPAADEAALRKMLAKIDAILPPRSPSTGGQSDGASVAQPTRDVVVDDTGAIRWDQMFGMEDKANSLVDLALAGGAAQRDDLLEAVDPAVCLAEPGRYAAVLAEIERGIRTGTGLDIIESNTPGWIGVQCDSQEMAIWLVRAIIVENVMVRRQGDVLYLPVGPHYRLQDETLSIVTVVVKTWRYWIAHITAQQRCKNGENP